MWDPQRLTTLWAFTACYRDSFTFIFTYVLIITGAIFIGFSLQGKLNAAIDEKRRSYHSNKETYFLKSFSSAGNRGINFIIT
jgi:hypothetical protein